MANPVVVTPPALEPVTLTEAKAHLVVDFSNDDTLITALIVAARQNLESFCNSGFVDRTLDYTRHRFPCTHSFELPGGPLRSITSVKYVDSAGVENTFDAANYFAATKSEPGSVVLAYGLSWPSATLKPAEAITVRYVAGYGATASTVPEDIRHAILMLVAHYYRNRGDVATDKRPAAVEALAWPYRVVPI